MTFAEIPWTEEDLREVLRTGTFRPKGEEGDWERCRCDCHRPGCHVLHCMPCCQGGWKPTFQKIGRDMKAAQYARAAAREKSVEHKPAHGGYPG